MAAPAAVVQPANELRVVRSLLWDYISRSIPEAEHDEVRRAIGTARIEANKSLFDEASALAEIIGEVRLRTETAAARKNIILHSPARDLVETELRMLIAAVATRVGGSAALSPPNTQAFAPVPPATPPGLPPRGPPPPTALRASAGGLPPPGAVASDPALARALSLENARHRNVYRHVTSRPGSHPSTSDGVRPGTGASSGGRPSTAARPGSAGCFPDEHGRLRSAGSGTRAAAGAVRGSSGADVLVVDGSSRPSTASTGAQGLQEAVQAMGDRLRFASMLQDPGVSRQLSALFAAEQEALQEDVEWLTGCLEGEMDDVGVAGADAEPPTEAEMREYSGALRGVLEEVERKDLLEGRGGARRAGGAAGPLPAVAAPPGRPGTGRRSPPRSPATGRASSSSSRERGSKTAARLRGLVGVSREEGAVG